MILRLAIGNLAGGKIDAATQRLMDTTQIKHQHTIDEHPHIIVAGKVEHHVLIVDLAAFRHVELGAKIHAERIFIILTTVSKWSEARSTSLVRTSPVVNPRELVRHRVICSLLGIGVETVIPILVQCQQSTSRLVVGDGAIKLPVKEIIQ